MSAVLLAAVAWTVAVMTSMVSVSCFAQGKLASIELRRTDAGADCDIGDVYVNGELIGVFSASVSFFRSYYRQRPILYGELATTSFEDKAVLGKVQGLTFSGDAPLALKMQFLMLNGQLYYLYGKPRRKVNSIPNDVVVLGTLASLRDCTVSAPEDSLYFAEQATYSRVTDLVATRAFDGVFNKQSFRDNIKTNALLSLTDTSAKMAIDFGALRFERSKPLRAAVDIAPGDTCLVKGEHMANTIIRGNSKSYERRDNIWFCPDGVISGDTSNAAIELARDARFIMLRTHEVCSEVLGIPINRDYVILRNVKGVGSEVKTRCAADQPWKTVSPTSSISY